MDGRVGIWVCGKMIGRKPLGLSHIFTEGLKVHLLTSFLNNNNDSEHTVLGIFQDLF